MWWRQKLISGCKALQVAFTPIGKMKKVFAGNRSDTPNAACPHYT